MDIFERFTEDTQDKLQRAMLESSILFSMNRSMGISIQRNVAFLRTVFAFIISEDKSWTAQEVADCLGARYHKQFKEENIQGAIDKLYESNWLSKDGEGYIPHRRLAEDMKKGINRVKGNNLLLFEGLVSSVNKEQGRNLTNEEAKQVKDNIEETFNLYFRMYGFNYAVTKNGIEKEAKPLEEEDLINAAKKDLPEETGNALLQVISDLIEHPTKEQAATMMFWVKTIVGLQVMQLDPQLSELEADKLKDKKFYLDTDFLLYCLCKNCRQSIPYRNLLKTLRKAQCELIIPEEVCLEIVKHAQCAESNYYHFKNRLNAVDKVEIETMATNIFVKDYCLAKFDDVSITTLKKYLKDNYLDDRAPLAFIKEVIKNELKIEAKPDTIEVAPEYQHYMPELSHRIYERTQKSEKDKSRSDEESHALADTDANLYLGVLSLNKNDLDKESLEMLSGNTYLVTYTTKGIKSAKEMGLNDSFVTRPELLLNLLSEIGEFDDTKQFINLFDNPFLGHIIDQNWEIISKLAESGVDLRQKSLTRLKSDLGEVVHRYLTNDADKDDIKTEKEYSLSQIKNPEDFYSYVRAVEAKKYKFMPEAQKLIDEHKSQELTILEKSKNFERAQALLNKKTAGYREYMEQMGYPIEKKKRISDLGYMAKKSGIRRNNK